MGTIATVSTEDIRKLRDSGWNDTRIAKRFGVHRSTVSRRLQHKSSPAPAIPKIHEILDIPEAEFDTELPCELVGGMPTTVGEAEKILNEFIGYRTRAGEHLVTHVNNARGSKILLINDLHVPFHNMDAIRQVVLEHAHDTDLLIIGGDLVDLFAVSRYEKFKQHFSLAEELRQSQAVLAMLAAHFKKIVLMSGNHDERWKKNMARRGMGPAEIEAFNILGQMATNDESFTVTDPLYCMARMLPNVEVVEPTVVDYAEFGFFYQIGDLLISHAEKFSRVPGQAANMAVNWFKSYAEPKGIVQPFRVLAQCHTHQAAMNWTNFGVWALECGCLCKTPDYAANPKLMGAQRDSKVGYSVFFQQDGRTDMTRSRFIPIEG